MTSKVKYCYWKRTHKYGIQIPKSVEEAIQIDKENRNNLWKYSTEKEMTNSSIIFDVKEKGEAPPRIYKEMTAYKIFDVKLDDGFTRKAIFVTYGHKFDTPTSMTHTSVVLRDSVWIVLMLVALNVLYIKCADLKN